MKHIDEFEAVFGEDEESMRSRRAKPRDGDEEFEMDEVTGAHGKRRKLDLLNKRKLSKYELDELFCE